MGALLTSQEQLRVTEAIAAAEARCSGELRVVIYPGEAPDPLAAAKSEFSRLGMHATRERNAVLILIAPASHTFGIFGDEGVDRLCGKSFWEGICMAMGASFREGKFGDGIVEAVESVGRVLAKYFPPRPDDRNELLDDVIDKGIVI